MKTSPSEYFVLAPNERTGRVRAAHAELAGIGARCSAMLLDYILTLLLPALTLVIGVYIKRRWLSPSVANAIVLIGYIATAALLFFNLVYFYVQDGQSFGKRFLGLRVVRADGGPLDYKTALLRNVVGYGIGLLSLLLGFLWALWDGRRQGWHDKLAGTIVVKE